MASCPICNDGKEMSKHGLKIHNGKVHGIHYGESVQPNTQPISASVEVNQTELVPCGHPFCDVRLPRKYLKVHWDNEHPTWLMSNGLYVWEAPVTTAREESFTVEMKV